MHPRRRIDSVRNSLYFVVRAINRPVSTPLMTSIVRTELRATLNSLVPGFPDGQQDVKRGPALGGRLDLDPPSMLDRYLLDQ